MKRSTCTLKLNKISRFDMVTKIFDELVIFHQNFDRSVQLSSSFGETLSYVSTKLKCIKLIVIGKITLVPVAFLIALSLYNAYIILQTVWPQISLMSSVISAHNVCFFLEYIWCNFVIYFANSMDPGQTA